LESNWLALKEKELSALLEEENIRIVDEKIIEYIKLKSELSNCRTLDAIHMATGLEFKDNLAVDVKICTYDERMRRLARTMNLPVLPIES
jgi:predicted nucleic acid-binding protein